MHISLFKQNTQYTMDIAILDFDFFPFTDVCIMNNFRNVTMK